LKPVIIIPVAAAILIGSFLIVLSLMHTNPVRENQSPIMINPNYILSISNGTIQVPLHSYTFYHFSAPNGSSAALVKGDFTMGGDGSNLRIYLLDDVNFNNWKNGHQFNAYYDSGNDSSGTIDVIVPLGKTLYLIYDNIISPIQSKSVYSRINLVYT
jgi:hypothetical protein